MAIKIAVANSKGGCAKTTTAICLAQELISRGYKTLFIDTDGQCNSTSFYEAKTEKGIMTVADMLCDDADAIEGIQHTDNGDIIPSDVLLEKAENAIPVDERRFKHLKNTCKGLDEMYDYIIIDTPPAVGVILKNVLQYVEYVVIPVDESGYAIEGLMRFCEAINMAQEDNANLKIAGILITKANPKQYKISGRIEEVTKILSEKIGCKRFDTKIRNSVKCTEALTEFHIPLHDYACCCTTDLDYQSFTDEIEKMIGGKK